MKCGAFSPTNRDHHVKFNCYKRSRMKACVFRAKGSRKHEKMWWHWIWLTRERTQKRYSSDDATKKYQRERGRTIKNAPNDDKDEICMHSTFAMWIERTNRKYLDESVCHHGTTIFNVVQLTKMCMSENMCLRLKNMACGFVHQTISLPDFQSAFNGVDYFSVDIINS